MNSNGGGNNWADDRLFELGRALSCRIRLSVLQTLAAGDASVSELVHHTDTTQPNMSNHLAVLRSAGLVNYRRDGRSIRYELASPEAADLVRNLTALAQPANPEQTDTRPS
jgi:DNA-binding transcriptional ArsR family regulator